MMTDEALDGGELAAGGPARGKGAAPAPDADAARAGLIEAARALVGDIPLRRDFSAGGVGAALRTPGGNVYTGICIDLACGLGFCAEVAAVAEMLKARETGVDMIVAVGGHGIVPPCGRCRETLAQLDERNLDCRVVLAADHDVPLRRLLPRHWLAGGAARS